MVMIPQHRPYALCERHEMRLVEHGRDQKLFQVALFALALLSLLLVGLVLDAHRVAEEARHGVVAVYNNLLREVRQAARVRREVDRGMQWREFREHGLYQNLWQRRARDERGGKRVLWARHENDVAGAHHGRE